MEKSDYKNERKKERTDKYGQNLKPLLFSIKVHSVAEFYGPCQITTKITTKCTHIGNFGAEGNGATKNIILIILRIFVRTVM